MKFNNALVKATVFLTSQTSTNLMLCNRQKVLSKSDISRAVKWSCWESEHAPGFAFGNEVEREV